MVLSNAIRYYENAAVMTTLTVKIPEALERSIATAARRERVTKSELVRRAMAKYVAQTDEDDKFQSALDLAGGLIGSVRDGPADLATNAKYMNDYGK
jgi:Ribbon-helix-helix protein, copG family